MNLVMSSDAIKLFSCLCLLAPISGVAKTEVYYGTARDESGKIVYREKHELEFDNERNPLKGTIQYLDLEGKPIAEIRADLKANIFFPNYSFRDFRFGTEHIVASDGVGGVTLDYKRDSKSERITKTFQFDVQKKWIINVPGLYFFLGKRGKVAQAADPDRPVRIFLPAKKDDFTLTVQRNADGAANTDQLETVKVELGSWFLRLFLSPIRIVFDNSKERFHTYQGTAPVADAENDAFKVITEYSEKP